MAANSDGCILYTIITFEGNLNDSKFNKKFDKFLLKLNNIVGDVVKVHKLEPWNSVRVTLSIPREAALRLRKLASEGSPQLRALGILSVQVEGDQVISLRIANNSVNAEPQEIVLQTVQDGATSSRGDAADGALSRFLSSSSSMQSVGGSGGSTDTSEKVHFKSPNVVCPSDSVVPKVPITVSTSTSNIPSTTTKGYGGPFPFTSMNQAIHSREGLTSATNAPPASNYTTPPPPYPGKPPPPPPPPPPHYQQQSAPPPNQMVTAISSPLLVNLLQNDGGAGSQKAAQKSPDTTTTVATNITSAGALGIATAGLPTPPSAVIKSNVNISNRTIPQNVYNQQQQQQQKGTINEQLQQTLKQQQQQQQHLVRTIVSNNRTLSQQVGVNATAAFVQKQPSHQPPPPSQRLLNSSNININNIESDVVLNNTNTKLNLNLNQVSPNPGSLIQIHVSQASTSSPSALLNTSSIRQNNNNNNTNNKLLSTTITPSIITTTTTTTTTNNHLRYPINNNININSNNSNNISNSSIHNHPTPTPPPPPPPPPSSSTTTMLVNTTQQHNINCSLVPQEQQSHNIINNNNNNNNSIGLNNSRILPPPPPYSVAVAVNNNRSWDSIVQTSSSPFMDLTPSLTDLKVDDLEDLLPTLERDLATSPPEIPDEITHDTTNDKKNFLINPLTGELEPQSSGESDNDDELADVFTGLPSPAAISDDDTNSTIRPDTTDQSDSETRSSHSDSGKHSRIKTNKIKDKGRDSPAMKPTEKIKLRLKLEKSEPINSAYKVDVRFIQQQQPKKASTSGGGTTLQSSNEELRVPPLHISLRGRHHAFITNKKKNKFNSDGTISKTTKTKLKKSINDSNNLIDNLINDSSTNDKNRFLNSSSSTNVPSTSTISSLSSTSSTTMTTSLSTTSSDQRKLKKFKSSHDESKNLLNSISTTSVAVTTTTLTTSTTTPTTTIHYKEKQKERRGSDSELARSAANLNKLTDSNGIISIEKKRRLSQSEIFNNSTTTATSINNDERPTILGSTNIGTIASLPSQKPRKEKNSTKLIKDGTLKSTKDLLRNNKNFTKNLNEKYVTTAATTTMTAITASTKQVTLPTGEIDMEAKFKQRLLEDSEKGVPRPPHRTEISDNTDKELKVDPEPPPLKEKSPEPDKCTTPDRNKIHSTDIGDNKSGRSPNSGAQGEDSGIESMDALSEKSPNQASQSPHADIPEPINKSKTQVPDMLDIEAQLAKMEGLNGIEDVVNDDNQENKTSSLQQQQIQQQQQQQKQQNQQQDQQKNNHQNSKLIDEQCELTSTLQEGINSSNIEPPSNAASKNDSSSISLKPTTKSKEDDLEPLPLRRSPPLYTYSNPDKGRSGNDSPQICSDDDSNSCTNTPQKSKSLLEQLLIEIPESQTPSSPSPATRSVRTRALSKLSSPELNSPVPKQAPRSTTPVSTTITTTLTTTSATSVTTTSTLTVTVTSTNTTTVSATTTSVAKRKRHESDSSNNGLDDQRNKKPRKFSENNTELIKSSISGGDQNQKLNNVNKKTNIAVTTDVSSVVVGTATTTISALTTATTTTSSTNIQSTILSNSTSSGGGGGGSNKVQDESSDSDEPLIEKCRKTAITNNVGKNKVKTSSSGAMGKNVPPVSTRRSVRSNFPTTPNTRSKGERTHSNSESEAAIRRKTRSAVSEGETKRKKEVK